MDSRKWVEFKPIVYVGTVLAIVGLFGPNYFMPDSPLASVIGFIVGIFGGYLVIYRSRKE